MMLKSSSRDDRMPCVPSARRMMTRKICLSHNELLFAGTMVAMPVQLRGPVVAAPRAARASRSRSTAVVAAASREQNAVPAAVLSLLLATAPLVDVSAAFAAVRIPP